MNFVPLEIERLRHAMVNRGLPLHMLRWCMALMVAAVVQVTGARSEDVPPPGGSGHPHMALDSTLDLNTFGGSFDVNILVPLTGHLNESGFRARFTGSTSWYKFPTGEFPGDLASGKSFEGNMLLGYGWAFPRLSMLLVGGPAMVTSHDDPGIQRTLTGGKGVLSIYATPSDLTMAYTRVSYSTIAAAFEWQVKGGIKVFNIGYLGPEAKFASRIGGEERRWGPHLSGIGVGPLAISLSGGWLSNQLLGRGHYFSVSLYAAF